MAATWTVAEKTVFGNMNVQMGVVTIDAVTGAVATGFNVIRHIEWSIKSAASNVGKFAINSGTGGTATGGTFSIVSGTTGDDYYVTVYGR
jgi:hypothetical protein